MRSDNKIAALLVVWDEDSIQRQLFELVRTLCLTEQLQRLSDGRDMIATSSSEDFIRPRTPTTD